MGYLPPHPPPPAPPPPRVVVDGPTFEFGLQIVKPVAAVGRVIMRGLGYGDQVAELVPEEVPMIITDAPGRPKAPAGAARYKCGYCGCTHRETDLKSLANCPNCCGNNLVRLDPVSPTLEQSLEARSREGQLYRVAQLLKEPDGAKKLAQALGPTLKRRQCYTASGGPR